MLLQHLRGAEVRQLLMANKPERADIKVEGAESWAARTYRQALESGDAGIIAAIEGASEAHPSWMRLTGVERREIDLGAHVRDHRISLLIWITSAAPWMT